MITASEVKAAVNELEIIGRYVQLKRSGNKHKGRCPFHPDDTASFHVYPDRRGFFCFGCGRGGDIITFIQLAEKLDFCGALRFLCRDAGIPIGQTVAHLNGGIVAKLSAAEARGFDLWLHLLQRALLLRQSQIQSDLSVCLVMLDEFGIEDLPDKQAAQYIQNRMTMLHKCCAVTDNHLDSLGLHPEQFVEIFLRRFYGDEDLREQLEI